MIKENDLKIISLLRRNSREKITSISRKTKIPVSTVYDRIKANNGKIIKKNVSLIDFSKLGYSIRMHLLLRTSQRDKIENFSLKNQNVNSVFRIDGDYDYSLDCIFKDMGEIQEFLNIVNSSFAIEKMSICYVLDEIVREKFLEGWKNEPN